MVSPGVILALQSLETGIRGGDVCVCVCACVRACVCVWKMSGALDREEEVNHQCDDDGNDARSVVGIKLL